MNRGYIRLWRKSLDSGLLQNHKTWVFFCYCLLKATHKRRKVVIGRQEIILEPGQFIFGRRVAAEETGLSEQEIRTALGSLITLKILTIKSTNKFSIITIVNWSTYQGQDGESNQQPNQHLTSNQPQTRTKECKKERKGEKKTVVTDDSPCPHQEILNLYHEILPELPRVRVWHETRQKNLRARWKEDSERQSLDWWKRFFQYVRKCPFLMGENGRNWQASLEWLINKSNMTKVIEGNYEHV